MTLPLRRKHPITALNSLRTNRTKVAAKLLARVAFAAAVCGFAQPMTCSVALAQQWQPTRNVNVQAANVQTGTQSNALRQNQTVNSNGLRSVENAPRPVLSSAEQVGTGVVLRWQTTAPRSSSAVEVDRSNAKIVVPAVSPVQPAAHSAASPQVNSMALTADQPDSTHSGFDNPLRQSLSNTVDNPVRPAAYQQEWTGQNGNQSPQWRSVNTRRAQEEAGTAGQLPEFPGGLDPAAPAESFGQPIAPLSQQPLSPIDSQDFQAPSLDLNSPQIDPLDRAESAPAPPAVKPEQDPPSFPPQIKEDASAADKIKEQIDPPRPLDSGDDNRGSNDSSSDELEDLLRRARKSATPSCISQRDMLRGKPLSSLSLDVSPKLSEGLSSMRNEKEDEKARKEFELKSMLRDWSDYKGNLIASGRLVDMRLGNIVLDVGGSERLIPISSLSDVDMSYIADIWNLPFRCGTGFEPLEGRNFVASTVQWKASGACHNPLYFEQVQLERYGHEVGPVLQPLISSAQFFLTIPLLPYKMGINPPNECQYALGYYRPGNCAPYMIKPFPWSLRGGLAEAAAVVGGVAVFP